MPQNKAPPLNTLPEKTSGSLRESLILTLLIIWLVFQIGIPFFRKFGPFPFEYRYATFSWAMFSKPALLYEVSLFKKTKDGTKEAIPNIKQYVYRYRSPEPLFQKDYYRTPDKIMSRLTRLVEFIAQHETENAAYGVSVRWIRKFDPNLPMTWEYEAQKK